MDLFRDRIIEFKKERAGDILDNPKNWRVHPGEQSEPLKGLLKQVGKVGALISYYSERLQKQAYIDGHLRKNINPDEMWWICYTDLTDDEADLVLASYDPIGAMAQADKEKLDALLQNVRSDDAVVQRMLAELAEKEMLYFQANEVDAPGLKDGDRAPFQQMTFTLHDDQAEIVKEAIQKAKQEGGNKSGLNENSNGNALALICESFING